MILTIMILMMMMLTTMTIIIHLCHTEIHIVRLSTSPSGITN